MTKKDCIIVTGGDAHFEDYIDDALNSLVRLNLDMKADIGILDLGLSDMSIQNLSHKGYSICSPEWTLSTPDITTARHQLGLVARTALRDYFPGYSTYIWFDADAWAQNDCFYDALCTGVASRGAAFIQEDGVGYSRSWSYQRWLAGNMIAAYGVVKGIRSLMKSPLNIGIMALADDAPHWAAWIAYYERALKRRERVNLDQHALQAALFLEKLNYAKVSAINNWLPVLSAPMWDGEHGLLCEPGPSREPISVIHLAGHTKDRNYELTEMSTGKKLTTRLTYKNYLELRDHGS